MHGEPRPAARGAARARSLTQLHARNLGENVFSSVPTEFQTFSPSNTCLLDSDGFSCANVGFGTTCCNAQNCGDTSTCSGAPPAPEPCNPSDTACDAGGACPGGTLVSAECADRSAFDESPCACTALQQLAALSDTLQGENPWNNLANKAYCQSGDLSVGCARVDGVKLPTIVKGVNVGLAGALRPSLGELGPSLTTLDLAGNAITSIPIEIGALTLLTELYLSSNQISELPTEFGALTGLEDLFVDTNPLSTLPTELGALTGLRRLQCFLTALTSVPTELGRLTSLTRLDLSRNAITSLPSEIAALTGLRLLKMNENAITSVPTEFRTFNPDSGCDFLAQQPPGLNCANFGFGTTCCKAANCLLEGGTETCYKG